MKNKISLLLVMSMLLTLFVPSIASANEEEKTITILGTSDMHGRIFPWDYALDTEDSDAGYLKVASVVKEIRNNNKNVILVDAGDTNQDNSIELFQGKDKNPIVEVMNDIGYDAWTLGNHEFNFGLDVLDKAVKTSKATVLAGNIYKEDGQRAYDAYKIVEKDGVKVAIIGMITPNIPRWEASTPDHFEGLEFRNPVEETTKVMNELKGKADVFIGVFHMGLENEYSDFDGTRSIVEKNPELDAVVMGHAHSDVPGEKVGETIVVEPKRYGNRVSKIDLKLKKENGKWNIVERISENIDTKAYAVDKDLEAKYNYVHETSRNDANMVIGTVTDDFIKNTQVLPGIPKAQVEDTALIDFINKVQMHYSGADISAAAAFKSDMNLLKGDFKKKDVANIYKYPNTLMAVKVTGKQLKDYMEWSARYYNTYKDGDVTVSFNPEIRGYNYDMFSGVDYNIDISKPEGQRIIDLKFKGQPVTDNMTFTIAVNNYRFGNMVKDGYFKKEDKVFDSSLKYADGSIRTLIVKYVTENKEVVPTVDNNWKIVGADLNNPLKDEVYNLVKEGKISIPTSEDKRTPNVKSLNIYELQKQGLVKIDTKEEPKKEEIKKEEVKKEKTIKEEVKKEAVDKEQSYIVKKGDALYKIAKKFNMDWNKLADYNNLKNPNLIYPNQVIKIPVM
ncbi:MAG: 5'-nucleotidase C-terminal domain-containing protein [Tepidibacter sp.]|jgi:2',3'-cyclic-nucleotide 2'-phosphodiesterase (5'-nucleotidase family)/LysM repeat protein|uniref:5'-nucleotidase C-terminal domain-containing protein n=1 Tax=Tepidibacter sp. TaxID=2529387 RepID=UPI0025ECFFF2|nr:5'-nucleotidase C-terminal domain-containing protein [Tepidibacter sp.]MCT4508737.1 5'-nucleotidase C-terminal domain-containing protein [Tepidibacter sp.]